MKWVPWDRAIDIPFDAARAVYQATSGSMDSKMVGNGEHLFAAHVTGSVSSDDKFDVLGASGERFEVKTLGNFRFNYEQTSVKLVYDRFVSITNELQYALSGTMYETFYSRSLDIGSKSYIGVKKVMGKTYANGRAPDIGLKQMAQTLFLDKVAYGDYNTVSIDLGADCFDVTMSELIQISEIVGMDIEYMEIPEINRVYSRLTDECFYKPNIIPDLWEGINPAKALLTHADKLVVVDKDRGYIIIDEEDIDNFVRFTGFSNGEAHFKTTKELKDVEIEVLECNTTSRQLSFTERDGDYFTSPLQRFLWCYNWPSI